MPKILVIEDDIELRRIYRAALERENFEVFEAANGNDGLQKFEEIEPDLIILDMMMPVANGTVVLEYLAQQSKQVRLIVITAFPQYRESALNYNVDQFLTKPIRPSEIVQSVLSALNAE